MQLVQANSVLLARTDSHVDMSDSLAERLWILSLCIHSDDIDGGSRSNNLIFQWLSLKTVVTVVMHMKK